MYNLQENIISIFNKNFVFYHGKDNDDYQNNDNFCCGNSKNSKGGGIIDNEDPEKYQYYYHSDHLGSASYITNLDGDIVQHIEYVPFGEVFLEEKNNKWNTPYLFNGKELDEETGLYYYGARYYNGRTSIWLSVDPMAEKYPSVSPYCYTLNNPVKFIDPDGNIVKPAPNSSKDFVNKFNIAKQTLVEKGVGNSLIQLINSEQTYYIKEGKKSFYKTSNKTIVWNTHNALKVKDKVVLNPIGVLGHEIEHAKNHDDAITSWQNNDKESFYKWQNGLKPGTSLNYKYKEEENIIMGAETNIARKLGIIKDNEITRDSYSGKSVRVETIYSNKEPQHMNKIQKITPILKPNNK